MPDFDAKYRIAFESSGDALLFLDRGGFLDCNQAALNIYGLTSKKDIIGKHPGELAPLLQPDGRNSRSAASEMIGRAFKEGTCAFEWLHSRADGIQFQTEVLLSRFEVKGEPLLQVVVRDITERKWAEQRLRESEANYRSIFEAANDGIAIHHMETGKIIEVNRKHSEMFGFTAEEIRSRGDMDLISTGESPYTQKDAFCWIRKAALGEPQLFEWKARDRLGHVFWSEVNLKRIIIGGKNRVLALVRDITQRKKAEDELKNSREQLRNLTSHLELIREEERKHISREIHDELGQALTVLKMDVSWLRKRLRKEQDNLDAKVLEMSQFIDATISTVQRICMDLRPRLLDDAGLVAAMEWHVKDFQNRTGIRCFLYADGIDDAHLGQAQSTTLFRIFQEGLTNVFRHANARWVRITLREDGDFLLLAIADDGRGITRDQIDDPNSFGLLGIRERVAFLGGAFEVHGIPANGTIIQSRIPLMK